MQNRLDGKQQELVNKCAKFFAEEVGPELGYTDLDYSMRSLPVVDNCLERVAEVIKQLPAQKRNVEKQAMINAASAYVVKTLADSYQLRPAKDSCGQLVVLTAGRQGWQIAFYVARFVEKKLEDPANESIVARFMIGAFLGEMFGGSNLSG